jgi:hypothetical protein
MTRTYFQEMLATKVAWGAKQEQERIIEVLEQAKDLETKGIASWFGLQSAIMIIKGEN